ncbi:hypothetical protein PC128_g9782 [Phytophthora cactorum]|nr:hypothetical protein PC128_g9782 [Phytophthora cactorum]
MQWGGVRRQKYFVWYETRKNKTISALALSLSLDLRATFKIDAIRDNMDAAQLVTRRLKPNEFVWSTLLRKLRSCTKRMVSLRSGTMVVCCSQSAWKLSGTLLVNMVTGSTIMIARHWYWLRSCSVRMLLNTSMINFGRGPDNRSCSPCKSHKFQLTTAKGKDKDRREVSSVARKLLTRSSAPTMLAAKTKDIGTLSALRTLAYN